MAEQFVTGMAKVVSALVGITKKVEQQVIDIVEQNAVRVQNHAKSGHSRGLGFKKTFQSISKADGKIGRIARYERTLGGHLIGRYENQTSNLTNSIKASDAQKRGNVIEATVWTNKEYAPKVEFGVPGKQRPYPFMQPAITANQKRFIDDLRKLNIGR